VSPLSCKKGMNKFLLRSISFGVCDDYNYNLRFPFYYTFNLGSSDLLTVSDTLGSIENDTGLCLTTFLLYLVYTELILGFLNSYSASASFELKFPILGIVGSDGSDTSTSIDSGILEDDGVSSSSYVPNFYTFL